MQTNTHSLTHSHLYTGANDTKTFTYMCAYIYMNTDIYAYMNMAMHIYAYICIKGANDTKQFTYVCVYI